jgi:hypothetical protein
MNGERPLRGRAAASTPVRARAEGARLESMASRTAVDRANVTAFLSRPWKKLAELKEQHWRGALDADPLATFRASEALWERLFETGHVTNEEERKADFEAHRRLRALLDRTRHVKAGATWAAGDRS